MDVKEAFISRRSVRRFLPDPIPKDKIKNIDTVHSSSRGHAKLANINSLIKETVDLRRELNSLLKFD